MRRPVLAGDGLDGAPPLDNTRAEPIGVNVAAAFEVPGVFQERNELSRSSFNR